ncbi:hypothetical protein A2U01_0088840, partial [Trifolium medium]|nr:hypothetical protein [Trifolium medium]
LSRKPGPGPLAERDKAEKLLFAFRAFSLGKKWLAERALAE